MIENAPSRRIRLCADDYGISPGVNRGIRELIERRRINATSVMMTGPAIGPDEINALSAAAAKNPSCAIGLHVVLTAPFQPLTMYFRPLDGGLFLPLPKMLRASMLQRLDRDIVQVEIAAQLSKFKTLFGRSPDYVDGHQHVQLFPQVRDAFLAAVKTSAPRAWVRQCGRNRPLLRGLAAPKAFLLDLLSKQFRRAAGRAEIAFNPGFAGAYDFSSPTDFAPLMQAFLAGIPDGGLIMCHPGHVDDVLISLDPLTGQREREYAFLAGDDFPRLLAQQRVELD